MNIRKLAETDYEEICRRVSKLDPWAGLVSPSERLLEALLTNRLREAWVSTTAGGKITGTIMFHRQQGCPYACSRGFESDLRRGIPLPDHTPVEQFPAAGYVNVLAVFPGYQRMGVGRQLMDYAESVTSQNASWMLLSVTDSNNAAQSFYLKLGYKFAVNTVAPQAAFGSSRLMLKALR